VCGDFRGSLFVCTSAGAPQTDEDSEGRERVVDRRADAVTGWWTPRYRRGLILALAVLVGIGGVVLVWEMSRYAAAVRRLRRGVGDTTFLSSDGKPWFRLDEQRHDVPLTEIAPNLQRAVVAVEDRRFFLHPGIDPIG